MAVEDFEKWWEADGQKYSCQQLVGTLHWVFNRVNQKMATQFLNGICKGTIPEGDEWEPVQRLFVRLQENLTTQPLTRGFTEVFVVKAWNALRARTSLNNFRWGKKEGFPEVSGWDYDSHGVPVPKTM